ncbi:MAG: AAA family ATPase [Eubacterium sp.]|nr:AAA family ATPase [Eubacterium sp.]
MNINVTKKEILEEKSGDAVVVCEDGVHEIGSRGPSVFSETRKKTVQAGFAKVPCVWNTAGIAANAVMAKGLNKAFVVNEDTVMVSGEGYDDAGFSAMLVENVLTTSVPIISPVAMISAMVVILADIARKNDELQELLKKAFFERNQNGAMSSFVAIKICDIALHAMEEEYVIQEMDKETIDASLEQAVSVNAAKKIADGEGMDEMFPCPSIRELEQKTISAGGSGTALYMKSPQEILEMAKEGKFVVNAPLAEDMRQQVPPLTELDLYVPTEEFKEFLLKCVRALDRIQCRVECGKESLLEQLGSDVVNACALGGPGTGKSTMFHMAAAALQLPHSIKTLSPDSEESDFQGVNVVVNGQVQTVDPEILKAFQSPGILTMEEIKQARQPLLMSMVSQMLEAPYFIAKNGTERIYRHPLCIVTAAFNPSAEGEIYNATKDRFGTYYRIEEPETEKMQEMLQLKGYPREHVEWVYHMHLKIKNFLKGNKKYRRLVELASPRRCLAALQYLQEIPVKGSEYTAIRRTMIDLFEDDTLREGLLDMISDEPALFE